jgi:transcription-repair coupling factor (superfamily II helicase)
LWSAKRCSASIIAAGRASFVAPRIADLPEIEDYLREQVPEVKFVTAHGQMGAGEIEERMSAFYDKRYDVLLSTTIVESGLDIPSANTLIIHRADQVRAGATLPIARARGPLQRPGLMLI